MKHIDTDTPRPETVAMIAKDFSESPAIGIIATGNRYIPVDVESITDAEGFAIRALRDWTRATTDRDFRLSMDAWEEMRSMVEVFHEGNYTLENARQDMGNLAALPYFLMVRHATELHQWFACKMHKTSDGSTDKAAQSYADFDAWQLLHSETGQLLKGDTPFDLDVADDPELYALCNGIKAWIEKRRIKFAEQDARKAQKAIRMRGLP